MQPEPTTNPLDSQEKELHEAMKENGRGGLGLGNESAYPQETVGNEQQATRPDVPEEAPPAPQEPETPPQPEPSVKPEEPAPHTPDRPMPGPVTPAVPEGPDRTQPGRPDEQGQGRLEGVSVSDNPVPVPGAGSAADQQNSRSPVNSPVGPDQDAVAF